MAKYIDAFVLVVPKNKVAAYKKMAKESAHFWIESGALSYRECMGDDLNPAMPGPYMSFPKLAKLKEGETVWFSYIEYESKTHRNQVNKKVMKMMDEFYKDKPNAFDMPFDMKRMCYGGFKIEVSK
ncbi:DUF1428 domain-containing protein [Candidatus Peregrinibacteria bacterium]|nr:MAG: DUF1428 domain-containing protein [Candidatus Peregrinibacteria bacterium]